MRVAVRVSVGVCVYVCMRACVRTCVRVYVRACVCVSWCDFFSVSEVGTGLPQGRHLHTRRALDIVLQCKVMVCERGTGGGGW